MDQNNCQLEPRIENYGIASEACRPENILWTDEPWKGRVTFTGPDGIGDHTSTVEPEHRYVGIGTMSCEGTSETEYCWRAAPGTPFPRPRTAAIGEVGWSVPDRQDWGYANTARQIMLGHFRQETEDRHSHKYQSPWYPGPKEEINPDSDAALVMNVYRSKSAVPRRYYQNEPNSSTSQSERSTVTGQRTRDYLAVHQ